MNPIVQADLERIIAHDLPWTDLYGKTVLITGANGFLPAYMVETLLYLNDVRQAGIRVLGLVRNRPKAERRFAHYAGRADLTFVTQDVCDLYTGPRDVDYIIHAACQASPRFIGIDPVGTFESNVFGTRRMLQLAKDGGVQSFLFFSSGEVYGSIDPARIPTGETHYGQLDPLNIRSCYGEGKRAGESLCVCWQHQYGVPVKIVRPFHTYGPGMTLTDGRIFADFVADVVARRNLSLKSDGLATRAFCYLADATAAFFTVLLKGENGHAYNVGSPAEHSMRALAEVLCGLYPERELSVVYANRAAGDSYVASTISRSCPDVSKLRALGWEPWNTLENGFARTIEFVESKEPAC